MPGFPIIDSHVHLYDPRRLSYGWMRGTKLDRVNLLDTFDTARGPVAVEGLVFAEVDADPGQHLAEAEFVQELADADPRLMGMVAQAPVEKGRAVEADLDALAQYESLRGIRRLIQGEVDPGMCLEPDFLEGVRAVGRRGLTFDICIKHWAMVFAIELVRRCPDVMFVLDHIGKPGIALGLREPWWGQMRELAALPNVVCKISGVVTEADHANWTEAQVTPYVKHAIECFGFGRVMYGSDWSVSEFTHAYPDWVAILDRCTEGCSDAEKRALWGGTARRVYRLQR